MTYTACTLEVSCLEIFFFYQMMRNAKFVINVPYQRAKKLSTGDGLILT